VFWNAYYHGYKATEFKMGGLSKNDFIDMVTRNRLSRSAAFLLFAMVDIQKHGFIDQSDLKKV
jgi:phosphatidylglycerophosphatase A